MTKRPVDIDDDKLLAVQAVLGTRGLKDTVNQALEEVLALDRRRQSLVAAMSAGPPTLADPHDRQDAWG